ncbi:hypothetical protein D7V91_11455 [bacterium 1xD42-67]|nr:hypothetical protein D7V91_11455 [bacterium 1xD42-67]
MGLFSKKCSVCGRTLPDKRKYKGVCDPCGMDYHTLTKQMSDTLSLVETAKTATTGYNRCLLGMRLSKRLAPFAKAGLYSFPDGSMDDQIRHFEDMAIKYVQQIRKENEGKKYDRKVGVAPFSHYKKLQNAKAKQPDGGCKACWEVAPLNKAGYCLECLARGTSISGGEIAEYSLTHDITGLSGDEIRKAATRWKLGRSVLNASL